MSACAFSDSAWKSLLILWETSDSFWKKSFIRTICHDSRTAVSICAPKHLLLTVRHLTISRCRKGEGDANGLSTQKRIHTNTKTRGRRSLQEYLRSSHVTVSDYINVTVIYWRRSNRLSKTWQKGHTVVPIYRYCSVQFSSVQFTSIQGPALLCFWFSFLSCWADPFPCSLVSGSPCLWLSDCNQPFGSPKTTDATPKQQRLCNRLVPVIV